MNLIFKANLSPTDSDIVAISKVTEFSPFNSLPYATACKSLGYTICTFALMSGKSVVDGCLGFIKKGRFSNSLELKTTPNPENKRLFWKGVTGFCRQNNIFKMKISTYASQEIKIPEFKQGLRKTVRSEHFLNLDVENLQENMSKNHLRNFKKAQKANLNFVILKDKEHVVKHTELINHSLTRRLDRGENVELWNDYKLVNNCLKFNGGILFQAEKGSNILSSMFVLLTKTHAYYHSGGSSAEGMKVGSSIFLMSKIIEYLKNKGFKILNLGGTHPSETGLRRFKMGFGTKEIKLESASVSMYPPLKTFVYNSITNVKGFIHSIKKHHFTFL